MCGTPRRTSSSGGTIVAVTALPREELIALFPTGGAIPETLQIGRSNAIDAIRADALGGTTLILAEDRHLGKSSVIRAVVDRALKDPVEGRLALWVDLRDSVPDSSSLAYKLLEQANAQGAHGRIAAMIAGKKLAKTVTGGLLDRLRSAGQVLGLGEQDGFAAATKLLELLTPAATTTLEEALLALQAQANAADAQTMIALDEAQELVNWEDAAQVQRLIAAAIKRPGSRINFVITGSAKHAIDGLYKEGAPMHGLGKRINLPEISRDDWVAGLADRFSSGGLTIAPSDIHQILYCSEGRPLKTMLICAHALDWLEEDTVTASSVERGIADALRHPSWSSA